jgi:acetyl-CoA C-acetyltransferase
VADAYEEADIEGTDVDVAEVHDCFSISEVIAYEDLGFCEPGEGGEMAESGETKLNGSLPVNTSGGLKSKGHPIGATGASQVVEVFDQLTDSAGERQVDDAALGLAHNIGGSGGAAVVHVFEREGAA